MLKADYSKYVLDTHLLRTATVLVDTREQENTHILDYFDKKGIAYKSVKLEWGDYTLILPKNEEYGIMHDLKLDFAVERKGSLEELSGNFTGDRARIEQELWRGNGKTLVLIENGSLDMIISKDYNTQYNAKSYLATIFTFNHRYNTPFYFCEKENAGKLIYTILFYKLREALKWTK